MNYTAHSRPSDGSEQTVVAHCRETAGLAAKFGIMIGLSKAAELAALLHDIGKLTADFNSYIHGEGSFCRGELDHSFAGAKYIETTAKLMGDNNLKKTASLIGRVILSHHGLHDWVDNNAKDIYHARIAKEKYYSEILQNLQETPLLPDIRIALEAATAEIIPIRKKLRVLSDHNPDSNRKKESFAFYLGMLERLLQSILIDADRTNTADFMSGTKTEAEYDTARLWQDMQQRMQQKLDSFAGRTDPISVQRQSISDRCAAFADHDVHICKLIVPTGGGKTLSSLRFAIEYANRNPVEKIIYIAPFMSILEQNSDVIREIAGEASFLEHHSDMLAEVSEDDDLLHEYELRTEKWDSPVIATTMVQFLNALFSGKTGSVRRMHRLSRAVIIIDEVQSIPLKCVYLFNLAMNCLSQICGSTVVLCSATQPPFDLLNRFPLLLDENSSMTGDTTEDFDVFRRTRLIWQKKTGGYSYDEAADFCAEQFRLHGSLLTVVNTKSAAKELYLRLKDIPDAKVFHLSTSMCPQHRRERIETMKRALAAKEPVICVTTQLIEAGVDISFGCVVRSLAGMDNAAQAAGRCNRNGEYPQECPVYILRLYEEKLGSLAEIKEAQSISEQLLHMPDDTDFLSVPLMSDYFQRLYRNAQDRNHRDLLRYPLKDTVDRDLINLLSLNYDRVNMTRNGNLQFCGQAFKTAGTLFEVIDSRTTDVIVSYNAEAEELIAALGSEQDPKAVMKLLRRAQKYAVSIYDGAKRQLDQADAIHTLYCGHEQSCSVQVMDKRFYHADYGITLEGGEHEVLLL
ncbi:MAG: CRISPR-associated helicase Cas3' [Acutalibacteraceae bacterium]|nr:CRISPR-associated helicase Cas3' [Acutalibacteraceae bacterium]